MSRHTGEMRDLDALVLRVHGPRCLMLTVVYGKRPVVRYGSPPQPDWEKFPNPMPTLSLQEGIFPD